MKKLKKVSKKVIIIYVIFYILLASVSQCFATSQNYSAECGEYLAEYARDFIEKYGADSNYGGPLHIVGKAESQIDWGGGSFGQGTFWSCCSSGVWYMFQQALGIDIYTMGYSDSTSVQNIASSGGNEFFEVVSISETLPGDILAKDGHVELVLTAGATEHANFGHGGTGNNCNTHSDCGVMTVAIRLKDTVTVDPSGTVTTSETKTSSNSGVDYSDFYFSGIPDGEYSVASRTSIFKLIVEALETVANYLIGLLTYIFRMAIVGWTAIFDNLFNWTVNTVSSTGVEEVNIGSTEITPTDSSSRITIESLFYGTLELLDINIFKTDE